MYDKKINCFKNFPLYSTIEENPKYPYYYLVLLNSWDMNKMDYVQKRAIAYFDGSNWYSTDVFNYDKTDWISNYKTSKEYLVL